MSEKRFWFRRVTGRMQVPVAFQAVGLRAPGQRDETGLPSDSRTGARWVNDRCPIFSCLLRGGSLNVSDVRAARDQINIGGLAYPPLPLHEAPPRPPSGYSQAPSVCSSSTSFNGPFAGGVVSPQPHSSYYSGLTGPQHPFYNRVRPPAPGSWG